LETNDPRSSHKEDIRSTLIRIGAISERRVELFRSKTRDNEFLNVFRDSLSSVIFINDFYVGDNEFVGGKYRETFDPIEGTTWSEAFEDIADSERRYTTYRQFIADRDLCDFGCGAGGFLKLSRATAKSVQGVELQRDFLQDLNHNGIKCHSSIDEVAGDLDVVSLFHCLEHLPNPTSVLNSIRLKLKSNGDGIVIIEVPHARDFLIDLLKIDEFIEFTLWSQHLVLHTRESLRLLLADAGFKNIVIEGVQRYGLTNHINWLVNKKPGGHKSFLSILQSPELEHAYKNALTKIDSTDTLVAIATT
jgi:2-polyprenyl-3-methyl-5-hydroxy-6-metoxy-1,4-benzoquinol methylase